MELRERGRAETPAADDTPAPPRGDRLRRLLALVAVLGALIAFFTLARPEALPSSRLDIGGDRTDAGERERADDAPEGGPDAGEGQSFVRPLDVSTLADVPANILTLTQDEWTWSSLDGELLAVPGATQQGMGEVRVVDARTFQPVATLAMDGPLSGFHGFTADADALVVQVSRAGRQTLVRHPLDAGQAVTGVDLPAGVELTGPRAAMLANGRVAMVVAGRSPLETEPGRSTVRVLVADLLAEQVLVDLPLPSLRTDFANRGSPQDASLFSPGFAWDRTRERLYVAHADSARVTVVDLAAGTVLAETEVGTPAADAGEEPVHRWGWAEVSPDGTRLYMAGQEFRPAQGTGGALGLTVIDTATLSELGRVEGVGDWLHLSPDGRWLLWSTREPGGQAQPGRADPPPRVALMDTSEIGRVTLLGRRGTFPLGFSRDSSHVYLEREAAGETVVAAYALPSLTWTGERALPREAWFDPLGGLLRERRQPS